MSIGSIDFRAALGPLAAFGVAMLTRTGAFF
jgi:hypothetical protein